MMLKVILYAYTQSVFSGRKIEKMLNDSIRMMWLSQNQKPSYKTINQFRVNPKVDALLESLFIQFYSQCVKQNLIDDKAIFIDGTKIEANANRYTFVWKKSIQNHESKMNEDSKALYHELVTNKIIPEIKEDHDNELTKEEIDLIGSHLDKEIEANANRYTFVWKKSIQNHESKMNEDSKALYHELVTNKIIPEIKEDHDNELTKEEIDLIGSHLDKEIEDLNQHINNEKCTKTRKQIRLKRTKIKKYKKQINDYFERKYRYEFQKSILKDRNSYSKTDYDATFMRMKEDHMKNGQLKPGYNLQIATNSQFVLSYNVYQNPTDTRTMIPFLNSIQETYGHLPEYIVADAGYGSESNYKAIIDDFNRTPLITYGMFIKDKTKKYKSDIFNTQNWNYDEINDEFICPNNKRLGFKRYAYRHDKYGYKRDFKLYECDDCSECPLKNQCMNFNSKTNKKIMKNYNWEYFKSQINKKLSEPETKNIYSQRKIDVEPVFGFMKAILGFTRMSVRGLNKVKRELGFVLMALNIRKVVAQRAENNQKIYKKDNFYIISIEIVFFHLSKNFMSRTHYDLFFYC
ncbi:IS1272 transposase [Staphylococcus aureus]|nr:IS1272 transposase [Staphylococcus aureus]